ncbi:hypothetical protein ACLKA6_005524 [Drosophila palustris]
MEQVCRACMTSSVALVDIFTDQREPCLADMLNECVDCEIKLEDQLPKNICLACIVEVQAAFGFKRKCEKSHQVLSAQLIRNVEVACDKIVAAKMEPTEEDIDLHNVKMEPEEFIGIEKDRKEGNSTEESYGDGPKERMTSRSDVNIQSELLQIESWELAEGNIDLGYVKIEEAAVFSTENEHTEGGLTAVEVCLHDKQPSNLENESVPKRNQFQCPYCSKYLNQSAHLNAHIRTHTGERPYKCPQCPKAFSHPSTLRYHLCIHSDERPFNCPYCPKSFSRLKNLQYHVKIHPGKKIHRCPNCPKYFPESADLEEHIRSHTGERTCTECPHCLKYVKGNLERHLRSHAERPHKCPHCPVAYARAAYLKSHIKIHSKKNP